MWYRNRKSHTSLPPVGILGGDDVLSPLPPAFQNLVNAPYRTDNWYRSLLRILLTVENNGKKTSSNTFQRIRLLILFLTSVWKKLRAPVWQCGPDLIDLCQQGIVVAV